MNKLIMHSSLAQKQSGAVLAISLIILLMLTLIGVSSYQSSITQTYLTANSQFQTVAFNEAEKGLVLAEKHIEQEILNIGNLNFSESGDGYYNKDDDVDVYNLNWDTNSSVESANSGKNKYIIQYHGRQQLPGEDQSLTSSGHSVTGSFVYTFVVTSRSSGVKRTERVLQSVYVTTEHP